MSPQVIDIIASFGPLGIAAAAIFWVFMKTSRRLDELTDNFQAQLREQAQGHNEREASLRDRYDMVIATYNDERLQVIQSIGSRLEAIEKELEDIEGNLKIILEVVISEQR